MPINRIVAGWSDGNLYTLRSKYKRKTDSKATDNYRRKRKRWAPQDLAFAMVSH